MSKIILAFSSFSSLEAYLFPESIGANFKKTSPNCILIFLDVEISLWSKIMLNNW